MTGRPQPEQQAPPVQRLRVKYAKRGRARFTSSRDFSRALERALRRAGVPMAYTSGFSPHPRISYANSVPTGAASEAEYLEVGLAEPCDPDKVRTALDAALPPGLDVVEVVLAPPKALADVLTGSRWRIDVTGLPTALLEAAVTRFLTESEVKVERMTKTGLREFDAREPVISLEVDGSSLVLVLAHSTPLVRPDDVLIALGKLTPDFQPREVPILTRLAQGIVDPDTGVVQEPL